MPDFVDYLNGKFRPHSQCMISVGDRGFGGDAVFDVERTFDGKIFKLNEHLDRLYRSLKYVRIDPGMTKEEMAEITLEVVRLNEQFRGSGDFSVSQRITRGVPAGGTTGRTSSVLDPVTPTVHINVYYPPFRRYAHLQEFGIHAMFTRTRGYHAAALDPKVKHLSRLNFTMAMLEVVDSDPEAWPVLLDHNGNIAEGVGGNFFLVTDGVIRTPTDGAVLQGISRQTVLELARTLGIPVIEEDLQPYDAYNADEVFISGTSHSMIPVSKVDFRPLKQRVPGPIFQQLMAAWDELVGLDIVEQARNMAEILPE
jgi:branched-chain amino acid aminotransferase